MPTALPHDIVDRHEQGIPCHSRTGRANERGRNAVHDVVGYLLLAPGEPRSCRATLRTKAVDNTLPPRFLRTEPACAQRLPYYVFGFLGSAAAPEKSASKSAVLVFLLADSAESSGLRARSELLGVAVPEGDWVPDLGVPGPLLLFMPPPPATCCCCPRSLTLGLIRVPSTVGAIRLPDGRADRAGAVDLGRESAVWGCAYCIWCSESAVGDGVCMRGWCVYTGMRLCQ